MVDVEIVDGGEVQFNSLVLHVFLECRHEIDFFFCFFGRGWKWVVWWRQAMGKAEVEEV